MNMLEYIACPPEEFIPPSVGMNVEIKGGVTTYIEMVYDWIDLMDGGYPASSQEIRMFEIGCAGKMRGMKDRFYLISCRNENAELVTFAIWDVTYNYKAE